MNTAIHIANYKPTAWPRCRDRERIAQIGIGDRRRICAEIYRDSNGVEVLCMWSEVSVGRCWRQVGTPFSMPARALELILEEYWQWGDGTVTN